MPVLNGKKPPVELVPLPDNPSYSVSYKQLIDYEKNNRDDYFDGELEKLYSVSELLNGIEKPEQTREQIINNYGHLEINKRKTNAQNYVEKDNNGNMAGRDINNNQN
jgi:hypothetical protein